MNALWREAVGQWNRLPGLFDWTTWRWLGRSKLVTSSIVWLFVVPVAAKILSPVAGEYEILLPGPEGAGPQVFHLELGLPFSWQLFYLMAAVFLLAQLVYRIWCPEILKDYDSFGDYRARHAGNAKFADMLRDALKHATDDQVACPWGMFFYDDFHKSKGTFEEKLSTLHVMVQTAEEDSKVSNLFYWLAQIETRSRRIARWLCTFLFFAGLVLLAWVMLTGALAVWETSFPQSGA